MFTGFGTDNVQGLLNGLLWGPDGWIYGVASVNGGTIENRSRPEMKAVSVRGRDFRFKPDGSAFEAISGGGQFGHCFDDWGHRFTCNNSNHIRQIVLPSHYLERNPDLLPPAVILDIAAEGPASPVYRISPAEPWRVVRTRQRAADPVMSRRLASDRAVCDRLLHLRDRNHHLSRLGLSGGISRKCVHWRRRRQPGTPEDSRNRRGERTGRVEPISKPSFWRRPTTGFVRSISPTRPRERCSSSTCIARRSSIPFSIPEPIKKHLDLTSGRDRGRLYALVHSGAKRSVEAEARRCECGSSS